MLYLAPDERWTPYEFLPVYDMGDLQEYLNLNRIPQQSRTNKKIWSEMIIHVPTKSILDHEVGLGQGITSNVRDYDGSEMSDR